MEKESQNMRSAIEVKRIHFKKGEVTHLSNASNRSSRSTVDIITGLSKGGTSRVVMLGMELSSSEE